MYNVTESAYAPENFLAGDYPIVNDTGTVATGKAVRRHEPVKLTANGIEPIVKIAASAADSVNTVPAKTEEENTTAGIYGIAAEAATAGTAVPLYLTGEFFANALVMPTGVSVGTLKQAFRKIGIFLKEMNNNA